jgi:hypothetical protein
MRNLLDEHMIVLPPETPRRNRLELCDYVIASIEELGIVVPATSRLMQMHTLYVSAGPYIQRRFPQPLCN